MIRGEESAFQEFFEDYFPGLYRFALARAGHSEGTLETEAKVRLDKDGDGFKVSRSDLVLKARIAGIDEAEFRTLADGAKANCPISKLLNAEIGLDASLA